MSYTTTTDTRINIGTIQSNDVSLEDDITPLSEESTVVPYTDDEVADLVYNLKRADLVAEYEYSSKDSSIPRTMGDNEMRTLENKYFEYASKRHIANMTQDPLFIHDKEHQLELFKAYITENDYNEYEKQIRQAHGENVSRTR